MKKKKMSEEEKQLEEDINELEKVKNRSEEDLDLLGVKKEKLKQIREKRMEGVLLRSRARWIAEGEKASNYFCNLEKRHYVSKNMPKLIDQHENTVTNQNDIVKEVQNFYSSLYRDQEVESCEIRDLVNDIPSLSEEEGKELEGEITLEEATCILKNMKNNKSPGTDGFSVEFFKMFWKKIGYLVVRALNTSFRKGELTSMQKQGIIVTIPKGDRPRQYLTNWRPISLLNVVYKIGSSCIASRLKNVLPKLINEDQTGFIRNRYIGDNIRLIYDTIAYLEEHKLPGLLLNIDFEKAFDSLSWEFMMKVLKAFGFQEKLCQWISTFYHDIKSCVIVNGQTSSWFDIRKGCRQGDPISPYLFVLCVEILAIMIRENRDIEGITINNIEHKLSQYADDTEFLLAGDKKSFEKCIDCLDRFNLVSGLRLNKTKTSAIWLGSRKHSETRYMEHLGFDWNPSKFKILGIWFTSNLENIVKINYDDKLAEVNYLFKIWIKRQLTPLGRIAVLKSIILSKLVHLWLLLPNPPGSFIEACQNLCYKFIWNKKPDKISRKSSHKSTKNGGIGLPDIRMFIMSLKLSWIRKADRSTHKWKNVLLQNCPHWKQIYENGPEYVDNFPKYNNFWTDVFESYKIFYYKCIPKNSIELLAEPLCYNKSFQIGKNYVMSRALKNKNIFFIGQFFDESGQILSHTAFKEKYDINIDFLTYAGYKAVISRYINKLGINVNNNKYDNSSLCFKQLFASYKGCKVYYDIFVANDVKPKPCSRWEMKLPMPIDWKTCFFLMHKIKDIKLQWFQLKIIYRCLGTNVILKRMGLLTSDNCSFCNVAKDSIEHMFWECHHVQQFWNAFTRLMREKCMNALNVQLTQSFILFGYDKNIKSDAVFDFMILFAKYFIYSCKVQKMAPLLNVFCIKLKNRFKIEEHIAHVQLNYADFCTRWFAYKPILDSE